MKFKNWFLLLFCMMLINNALRGQDEVNEFGINPKIGSYSDTEKASGFVGGLELNFTRKNMIYSVDYYYFDEFTIVYSDSPKEYFHQMGAMVGQYSGGKIFRFQYQGGLGAFWGQRRTDLIKEGGLFSNTTYESEQFFTVGLAIKLGFKVVPLKFMSIGIDLQANMNPKNTVFMPMLSLEFGKLRNKLNN